MFDFLISGSTANAFRPEPSIEQPQSALSGSLTGRFMISCFDYIPPLPIVKPALAIVNTCALPHDEMTLRLKIFTLGLVLALAATTQCFARCDVSAFLTASAPMSNHCGSHQQHHSNQPCAHQHEQLFSPEQGIDFAFSGAIHAVFVTGPAMCLPVNSALGACATKIAPVFPPGGVLYLALSSLRI